MDWDNGGVCGKRTTVPLNSVEPWEGKFLRGGCQATEFSVKVYIF